MMMRDGKMQLRPVKRWTWWRVMMKEWYAQVCLMTMMMTMMMTIVDDDGPTIVQSMLMTMTKMTKKMTTRRQVGFVT
jgi:hypothetical protein